MIRTTLAAAFLLFQVVMIVRARFHDARYYCWAPHDRQTEYTIEVEIDGRRLTPTEVADRYRDPWRGVNPRSDTHVLAFVRQYEQTYGRGDDARVVVHYSVNGGPMERWQWPPR